MTDFPRIKVTPKVAKQFANISLRNKTHDGNYILWMSDINSVPGDTIADRTDYVGGAMLTPMEAKMERQGTAESYKPVFTPVYLDNQVSEQAAPAPANVDKADTASPSEDHQNDTPEVKVNIPKVEASAEQQIDNLDTKEE